MIEYNYCPLSPIDCLEDFLKENLSLSKNQLKKFLTNKSLKSSFQAKSQIYIPIELLNKNIINPIYSGSQVKVISDTQDFLVLSKPIKTHCHPLHYNETDNLLSFIRQNFSKDYLEVNMDSYDRGLLYRLDFETSGLIIYAKKESVFQSIRADFNNLVKEKIYYARVEGKIDEEKELTHYLQASGAGSHFIKAHPQALADSKKAVIKIKPLSFEENSTLLEINLTQGHRHQIRAQLAQIAHPIVGDTLYGAKEADRLYLHCHRYQIHDQVFEDKTKF